MEPLGVAAFVVGGVALLGAALFAGRVGRHLATHGPSVSWRALAAERAELTFTDIGSMGFMDPLLTGEIDGFEIKIEIWDEPQGKRSRRVTRMNARLPGLLPPGLRLQVEGVGWKLLGGLGLKDIQVGDAQIDSALRITSTDPAAAVAAFRSPAVGAAIRSVLDQNLRVILEGRDLKVLQVGVADREVGERYDQLLAVARAVSGALTEPWRRMAQAHGLVLKVDDRRVRVDGRWAGLQMTATAGRWAEGRTRTSIRVRVPAELPRDLWILRRDEVAPEGCLDLPDPVIGHLLCVRCPRPGIVPALLDDDELRTLLLEVIHGHPGSAVQNNGVMLEVEDFVTGEIEHEVDLAARLARALAARA